MISNSSKGRRNSHQYLYLPVLVLVEATSESHDYKDVLTISSLADITFL